MSQEIPTTGEPGRGPSLRRLWFRAWALAAGAGAFGCVYFLVRQHFKDGIWRFDLTLVNKSLGVAALLLLALSMTSTGLNVLGKRNGRRVVLRKYYGLVGFWTGLAHAAADHWLLPAAGVHPEGGIEDPHADAVALAALALFALMAAVSNDRARMRLGTVRWRKFLRYAGTAGLVLAAAHATLLKGASWARYVRTFSSVLPSLSLPVVLFAAAVVLLRLVVWISRGGKKA